MKFEIKNRDGGVLFECDAEALREVLEKAVQARAYLTDANLARANLADANLADADLAGAYLAGANLTDANLARANLAGAKNHDPSASVAHEKPYERSTRSRQERMLDYRARHPDIPVVEGLDGRILNAIEAGVVSLEMGAWHTCGTTHCRGGLAIHMAGEAGYALEKKVGNPAIAARMIYRASTSRSPWFYDTNEGALADIKRCAAEESAENQP